MRPDATHSRFLRLPRLGRGFAVVAIACAAFGQVTGCTSIPTAQTAAVESTGAAAAVASTSGAPAPNSAPMPAPDVTPVAVAAPAPVASAVKLLPVTVVRVVDGDTAVFLLADGTEEKVRFIGIDAPESTTKIEPYGKAASAYTSEHLSVGNTVFLEKDAELRDRYGRLLAYVWLSPPTAVNETELRDKLFNAQLAIDGYAQQMTIAPNVKYADSFKRFVAEARADGRGLWGDDNSSDAAGAASAGAAAAPVAANGGSTGAAYIGNRNTKKFHLSGCSSVSEMNPGNKVALATRSEAIGQGYVACKRCRP